ncbi:hypothetical protein D4764_13G0010000 [Takifugu flavidus]|uniref:Uncharacterized protein n=1 Tax=Takifugu flavidus TaxID=433684 RepID=A0A5C6PC52_9TELE|nr:hypothetical protein D4764_13G0010000 [Takifugu flavidus]
MPPVISLHSQFLCVWQLAAAGASTAGFLEKVAADLERELRTFKYPAMFSAESGSTHDETRSKEGAKRTRAFCNIPSGSTAPLSRPGGRRGCYVRDTGERKVKTVRGSDDEDTEDLSPGKPQSPNGQFCR